MADERQVKIVLAGGGTLGSVTPLLAAAEALGEARPGIRFVWIGTKTGPERLWVKEAGIPFRAISAGKLRRYFSWKNFSDVFRILAGFIQSWILLGKLRPDIVVSAGSFVAAPVVWAAALRRLPVHLHQMDIRPGLANRLSAPFASSMSAAFEKSLSDFRRNRPVLTGNPVRQAMFGGSRQEAERIFGLDAVRPLLLVLGGGTGAESLNSLVAKAMPLMAPALQVLHVTGRGKPVEVVGSPAGYRQVDFLTADLRHAYARAGLVVTRAGMGTLTELAALGLPAVIVPIPDSHQEENAEFFVRAGAAEVISEKTAFSKAFAETVLGLIGDKDRLEMMRAAMGKMNRPDAAKVMAEAVIAAAGAGR